MNDFKKTCNCPWSVEDPYFFKNNFRFMESEFKLPNVFAIYIPLIIDTS